MPARCICTCLTWGHKLWPITCQGPFLISMSALRKALEGEVGNVRSTTWKTLGTILNCSKVRWLNFALVFHSLYELCYTAKMYRFSVWIIKHGIVLYGYNINKRPEDSLLKYFVEYSICLFLKDHRSFCSMWLFDEKKYDLLLLIQICFKLIHRTKIKNFKKL